MSVMPNSNSLSLAAPAMELDEKSLAQRFAEGDAAAFEAVVAIHRPRIARLVYRLLGWPADVDDMVQEVFLAALTKCRKFRGESALATWLTVIALNKCRTHRRGLLSRWRTLRRASRRPAQFPRQAAIWRQPCDRGCAGGDGRRWGRRRCCSVRCWRWRFFFGAIRNRRQWRTCPG